MSKTLTIDVFSTITGDLPISITKPAKGGTPEASVSGTGYTGTITWEPAVSSGSTFAANTVYTANVELTAKTGYQFTSEVNPTVVGATTISDKSVAVDGSTLKFKATFPVTAGADALSGSVTITGTPKIGEELTADTTGITSSTPGTLSYKWYRVDGSTETSIDGATGNTYTPNSAADVGKTIKVEVTAANYSSSLSHTTTAAVAKADGPAAPSGLAEVSKTDTTITVTANNAWEYSKDNGTTWQDSNTFTDLTPNTAYSQIVARVKETATHKASAACSAISITTAQATADDTLKNTLKNAVTAYAGIYDGTAHNAFTVGSLPTSWTAQYATSESGSYSGTMPQVTNVSDSKTMWVKFSNSSYSDFVTSYSVSVTARDISGATITLDTAPTYDGTEKQVTISSVTVDGLTLATSDYDISAGTDKTTNVETKTLAITGKGNYTSEATATWTLQAKDISGVTVTVSGTYTYTGSAITPTYTVTDGSTSVAATNYTAAVTDNTNAGSATITLTGKGNYTGTKTETFTIGNAAQTITVPTAEVPVSFSGTLDLSTVCSSNAPGATLNFAVKSGSTLPTGTTLSGSNVTAGTTEGTFVVIVDAAAVTNYDVAAQKEFTIKIVNLPAAAVTTAPTAKTGLTYNGTEQTLITAGSGGTGGTLQYKLDGGSYSADLPKAKNAGTYTVYYKVVGNGTTHSDSAEMHFDVEIKAKTLTSNDLTYEGAITKVYDGSTNAPTGLSISVKPTSLVSGDTLPVPGTLKYNSANVNEANKITFTPDAITTGNYALAASQVLTITGAKITAKDVKLTGGINATDRSYVKDNKTVDLTKDTLTFDGLVGSETLDVNIPATGTISDAKVGAYNVTYSGVTLKDTTTGKASNYKLVGPLPAVTVNITQAATPTAPTGLTGVKGQALSTVSLAAHPGWSWADGTAIMNAVGSQSFNASYHDANGNYADGTKSVSVNVLDKTNASVTINGVPASKTYGDADFTLTASAANMGTGTGAWTWSSSDSSVLSVAGTGANATVTILKAGSATISAKYESDTTMDTKTTESITINKATVTVAAKNQSIYVGGTVPSLTSPVKDTHYTVTGLVGSDTLVGTLAMKYQKAGVDATPTAATTGTYDIVISGVSEPDTTNYNPIVLTKGTLTISNPSYSGGGGGSYTPSYSITVDKTENGTITVSPKSASKGDTVTITVKPDKGYELEMLKALDKDGDALKLTEKNGKYTFKMPSGKVTVKGSFVEEAPVQIFKDVPVDAYYYEAVKWAAEKGITGGVGNGLFGPNDPCTRAQIVTFLWRAAGSPAPKHMSSFADVPADAFYAKAVAWAVENGITGGTGDGKFSPDATCTRAQSVTFLYRAAGSPKVSSSAEFGDVATNAYYADAVAWAAKNGITGGIGGGLFGSGNDCTRAQIVTLLYRAYSK